MPSELLPNGVPTPRFRLTDLSRLEKIVEDLAQTWTEGRVVISRDDGNNKMMIWEVGLQQQNGLVVGNKSLMGVGSFSSIGSGGGGGGSSDVSGSRKRKRVVDEDADSAAGNEEEETYLDEEEDNAGHRSLANLSKEMREVYTILQKSTAKGRLLAEQVCLFWSCYHLLRFNYPGH